MNKIVVLFALAGCAAAPSPRGPVVTRVSRETEVCLNHRTVAPGQRIEFVHQACRPLTPKSTVLRCDEERLETAEVLRLVGERCLVVRLAPDTLLRSGDELAQR